MRAYRESRRGWKRGGMREGEVRPGVRGDPVGRVKAESEKPEWNRERMPASWIGQEVGFSHKINGVVGS